MLQGGRNSYRDPRIAGSRTIGQFARNSKFQSSLEFSIYTRWAGIAHSTVSLFAFWYNMADITYLRGLVEPRLLLSILDPQTTRN